MKERRWKRFPFTPEGLISLVVGLKRARVSSLPFPDDVEAEGVYYDNERALFWILLYHPSFPIVEEGGKVPEVEGNVVFVSI